MAENATNTFIRPDIFEYHDYREFIKDWFASEAHSGSGVSMRSLARQMGYSHNFFHIMLSGKNPLTMKAASQLAVHMGLNEAQVKYLCLLIEMAEEKDPLKQEKALRKIQKNRKFVSKNPKEFEVLEFLSEWYYLAIREMAVFSNFKAEPKWIQARLKERVPVAKIRRALEFLVEHEFIMFDTRDRAFIPKKPLYCRDGIFRVALSKFHKHMLEQVKHSVDAGTRDERQVVAYTMALSQENYKKAQDIVNAAKEELAKLEQQQEGEPNSVYYFNFANFPMATRNEREG